MRLNISELKKKDGHPLNFDFSVSLKDLGLDDEIKAKDPLKVNLLAAYDNEKKSILVDGNFSIKISSICHRCAKDFTLRLEESFQEMILEEDLKGGEEEVFYANGKINLIPFIREHFLLKLPIKFLCSEECPGICSECGQDLSIEDCGCNKDKIDPRLEVLKTLLKDRES